MHTVSYGSDGDRWGAFRNRRTCKPHGFTIGQNSEGSSRKTRSLPVSFGADGSGPSADLEALGQNLEHLAALQFLGAAAGEHAGVRNLVQRLVGRVGAHLVEARGKPHLADERL